METYHSREKSNNLALIRTKTSGGAPTSRHAPSKAGVECRCAAEIGGDLKGETKRRRKSSLIVSETVLP